jgi:DNA-3-methyladenine glycosylase II
MNQSKTLALTKAERALIDQDPLLGELIKRQGTMSREPRSDYFTSLVRAIVGQQLSVKAASSIFERLRQATNLDPKKVNMLSEDEARALGLSRPKARYIHDLAAHFVQDSAVFNHLDSLNDDEVIKELTAIKGIGIWTAQMFLMFTLTRPDVFAPDDVGLQQAMKRLYGWQEIPSRAELETFAQRWSPYRTTASWHLWYSLDNTPK